MARTKKKRRCCPKYASSDDEEEAVQPHDNYSNNEESKHREEEVHVNYSVEYEELEDGLRMETEYKPEDLKFLNDTPITYEDQKVSFIKNTMNSLWNIND